MSLIFHKKPIGFSAKTLNTLLDKYSSYAEEIKPIGDDRSQYEEYSSAANLIAGGIKIIKSSRDSLQALVDKLEKEFDDAKSKGNKKDLISEIEDIDTECKFTEKIARANEMIYVLEARLTESRNKLQNLAQKLGVDPNKNETAQRSSASTKKESTAEPEIDGDSAWLSEDLSNDAPIDMEDAICRTLRNFPKYDNNGKKDRTFREQSPKDSKGCVFCKNSNHTSNSCRTVPRNNGPPEPKVPYQNRGERQPWNGNNSSDARNNRPWQGRTTANNACESADTENVEEIIQPIMVISHPVVAIPNTPLIDPTRFSRYKRVLRTLAIVGKTLSRWIYRCNLKSRICSDDIAIAEKMLFASEHRGISIEELRKRFPHINIIRDKNEESLVETNDLQPRLEEEHNEEEATSAIEPSNPLQIPRISRERASKTRAYEVIQNFERHLDGHFFHTNTYCSMWTILTILLCAVSTGSANNSLMCADGSAIVDIQKTSFELCFNRECRTFISLSKKLILKIPASPLHKLATVSTRILKNNFTETIECPPTEFCEYASQLMTSSLIGNPHCWPTGAIASMAIIVYALGTIILLIAKAISHFVPKTKNTTHSAQEIVVMNTFNPRPLNVSTTVTTMLVILAMLSSSQACQHGHMRHSVDVICNNAGNCSYEYNQEVLFNHIQSELCINARYENKTIGVIKIRQKPLKLVCSKVLQFFTRDTKHKIFHTTRCAEAGSCSNNRCNTLKPYQIIKELQAADKYPGYSACEHTCGGLLCGCFLPVQACFLIRVAQIPCQNQCRNSEL
ncbi:putative ATP synthase F0, A subunit [Ostertagia ostertagi]